MVSSRIYPRQISLSIKVIALSLLILLSAMPTAGAATDKNNNSDANAKSPQTYAECLTRYNNVSLNSLDQGIKKSAKSRLERLDVLNKKIANSSLTDAQKATLTQAIESDKAVIIAVRDGSVNLTDVKAAKENYCKLKFNAQVFTFRTRQVVYALAMSKYLNRDVKFMAKLQKPYNNDNKGKLSDEVNKRTALARSYMTSNIKIEAQVLNYLLAKSASPTSASSIDKPDTTILKNSHKSAYKAYTESWVLKKAASSINVQKDANISLVSIELLDDKGNVAEDHLQDTTKAKVVVKVDGKEITRKLERKNPSATWQISKSTIDDSN